MAAVLVIFDPDDSACLLPAALSPSDYLVKKTRGERTSNSSENRKCERIDPLHKRKIL